MTAYRRIPQLFWLGVLTSFFSCAEDETTYQWMWGSSWITEHWSTGFAGYDLGCALLGDIAECTPNSITFSCGYRIDELPREAKHYVNEEKAVIDDGPLDDFEVTGVVLLVLATQSGLEKAAGDISHTIVSDVLRIARTVDEIEKPEEVFFESVALVVDNPECSREFERCWGEVHPTFIICWDNTRTGARAYQFVHPSILTPDSFAAGEIHPGCDEFNDRPKAVKGLGVYWPLIDTYAKGMEVAPEPENWPDWIDQVLPRP